ncbi:hypothetical protein ACFE04_015365 [Oxalis oulophora]
MARSSGSPSPAQPKILLAKPGLVTTGPVAGKYGRGGGEDETASHRSRLPPSGSVNLVVSDLHINGSVYVFRYGDMTNAKLLITSTGTDVEEFYLQCMLGSIWEVK